MPIIEQPELSFDMFTVSRRGIRLAVAQVQKAFGEENYSEFRRYGKKGEDIPEEIKLRVDQEMYAKMALLFVAQNYGGERLWHEAMKLSNRAIDYARGILFPDQDKRCTMTVNIAWSDNRPSTALKIFTTPKEFMGEQGKFEQGRQMGWAWIGAQAIMADENGEAARALTRLNDFLESDLFIGRKGDPKNYPVFSYHTPYTNKVQEITTPSFDSKLAEGLWVKELEFPVRILALRDPDGEVRKIPVLYDQREKDPEAVVIKAKHRSLQTARATGELNGGLIEAAPYMRDKLGFRLVLMKGDHLLRDRVTFYLEELLQSFEGFESSEKDDFVDPRFGDPNKFLFTRRNLRVQGLFRPIEMQVFTLKDWLDYEYEVGQFDPSIRMHDGLAHDLYKLWEVAEIAEPTWPKRIYGIDHLAEKKDASYDYAFRLVRKQRIYPPPYEDTTA